MAGAEAGGVDGELQAAEKRRRTPQTTRWTRRLKVEWVRPLQWAQMLLCLCTQYKHPDQAAITDFGWNRRPERKCGYVTTQR